MPARPGRPPVPPLPRPAGALPAAACVNSVLDMLDLGVLMCDADGHVLMLNRQVRQELARGVLLTWAGPDRLMAANTETQAQLRAAWHGAAHQGLRRLLMLRERSPQGEAADGEMDGVVAPTRRRRGGARRRGHSGHGMAGESLIAVVQPPAQPDPQSPCAVMLLARRRAAPDLAVEMLGSLFELTYAERRVLTGLLGGLTVRALTRVHGVAESTIRSQVAALRNKFGVRRIEDLHRLVADMPPLLSAVRHSGAGDAAGPAPEAG